MDTNFLLSLGLKTNKQLYEEWKINRENQSGDTNTTGTSAVTTITEDVEDLVKIDNSPSIFSPEEWATLTGENTQYTTTTGSDENGNTTEQRYFNGELIETVTYSVNEDGTVTETHKYANGSMAIVTRNGEDYSILYYNSLGAQTKSETVKNNEDGSYTKTVTQDGKIVRQEFSAKDFDGKYTMTEFDGDSKLSYHVYDVTGNETYAEYYDENGNVLKITETQYYSNGKVVTEKEPGAEGEEGRVTSKKTYDNADKIVKKEIYTYNENGEAEIETISYTHTENSDGSSYIIATSDKSKNYKVLNYDADGNLTVVYEYEFVSENESTLLTATTYKNGKVTGVVDCVLEKNKAEVENLLKKYNAGAITLDEIEEKIKELKLEYTRSNSGITVELNENTYYSFEYNDVKATITSIIADYTNKQISYEDALRNINRLYGNVEIKKQDLHSEHVAYIFVDGIQFTSVYQRKDDIENTKKTYDTNIYSKSDLLKLGFTEADIEKYFKNSKATRAMTEEEIAAKKEELKGKMSDTDIEKYFNGAGSIISVTVTADNIESEKNILKSLGVSDEDIAQKCVVGAKYERTMTKQEKEARAAELKKNGVSDEDIEKYFNGTGMTIVADVEDSLQIREDIGSINNFEIYDLRDLIVNLVNRRTRDLEGLFKEFNNGVKSYDDIKIALDGFVEYTEDNNGITVNYNGMTFFFKKTE